MNDQVQIYIRRAPIPAAKSWNPDERTLEVVVTTGAGVERGAFIEKIALDQDWQTLVGKPVLNAHRRGSLKDVLGHVVKVWSDGREAVRATIKLSRRADVEEIIEDVLAGHIRGISFGYTVSEWQDGTENGRRIRTITKLNPLEISLVPIPADGSATIRGSEMPEANDPANQPENQPATPPDHSGGPEDRAAINQEIRSVGRIANMSDDWVNGQIDANATVEEARAAAFGAMRTRNATAAQVRNQGGHNDRTLDNPEVRARAIGEAIYLRVAPDHQVSEPARQYVGMTLPEIGRECLRSASIPVTGLGPNQIVTRALHSTSDFAIALGDTVGRTMRASYQAAPSGLKAVARETTLRDFRERKLISTSQFSTLEKVNEHGEFKRGTFEEAAESISLATFGKVFGITRQALVNDDIGVFADVPRKLGTAAAQFEAAKLAELVNTASGAGPTMSDGKTLFHADHANIETVANSLDAPTVEALSTGRQAMRAQVDASGQLIAATPKFILVPSSLETTVEQVLASIYAATVADVNPMTGRFTPIVEPRLDDAQAWYLIADPAVIDGLMYAHLEGESGPQIETRAGFDVDGVETRIRLDFGAAFADWRSWYRNPGA